ncbi:hypothetical protein ACXR2U_05825 [Jatrophihabitans sp. YIM 134969]
MATMTPPAPPRPAPRRRRFVRTAVVLGTVAVLVAVAVVGIKTWWDDGSLVARIDPGCTAGNYEISTDQAAVAADLVSVVVTRQLPARASTLLVTAAIQESKLRNIPAGQGDRDSVGVLQQRPSQGWGTAAELSDPTVAAGRFLDAVVKVPGWETEPAAEVIQAVQISVDGSYYAEHEAEGKTIADALDGTTPAGLTCRYPAPTEVAPASTVAAQVLAALPVTNPTVDSATVTVPGASWTTAAWFVANGDRLGLESVSTGGRTWTRTGGWATAEGTPAVDGVRATLAAL